MLVLSRKVGERIQIGEGIVIEVRRVAGNRVTIAVEAPRDMRILRGELIEAATAFDDSVMDERPAARPAPLLTGAAMSIPMPVSAVG